MVTFGILLAGSTAGCSQQAAPTPAAAATPARQATQNWPAVAQTERSRQLTRYARLLAGVNDPDAAADDPLRASTAFRNHAQLMAPLWASYQTNMSTKIRPWAEKSLTAVPESDTLFYPFGGADFMFPDTFFPKRHTYVLLGLERVGIPAGLEKLPVERLDPMYARVQKAITPLLKSSFFVTLDMQSAVFDDGVVTVFEALLGGAGHRIVEITLVGLGRDGAVSPRGNTEVTSARPGVRIDFVRQGESEVRTLYYFREDISDKGLASLGGLLPFVDTLGTKVTFVKAASYCMHGSDFSTIRNYVLTNSLAILQDDTGVPYRFFQSPRWDVHYFGLYTHPIPVFQSYKQPALAAAFAKGENVGPLDFRIGYGDSLKSHLILAIKTQAVNPAR